MNQLDDLLRDAYGEERLTTTVSEIELRAGRVRRRRTTLPLLVAAGLAAVTVVAWIVIPRPAVAPAPAVPPSALPAPSTHPTPTAFLMDQIADCREKMLAAGHTSLHTVEPIVLDDERMAARIYSDGNAMFSCLAQSTSSSSMSSPATLQTPLSRTALGHLAQGDPEHGLIIGLLPPGMRRVEHFTDTATTPLANNGVVFYGMRPIDRSFSGLKASADNVFTATAQVRRQEPATTRADQQAACRALQLRMPVFRTDMALRGSREADGRTSVLLLAGDSQVAVCTVFRDDAHTLVHLVVADHPIYDSLLEREKTSGPVHKAVVLAQRIPGDAGRGRVVLSNGQRVPLVFGNGYATAWFDRPDGVHAERIEIDLAAGGRTDFPAPPQR